MALYMAPVSYKFTSPYLGLPASTKKQGCEIVDQKEVKVREVYFGSCRKSLYSAMSPTTTDVCVNYTDIAKWSSAI